ncbi:MAG: hypothetical protein J5495_00620 [Bacteroidales bacterium]|nr:hypothetical protein [Bacteroidales bacterium]
MKKIFYIFAALLFAATACNVDINETVKDAEEGTLVPITFSVQMPEAELTRAQWGEDPVIENLWVIEFGAAGFFKRWVQASPEELVNTNGEAGKKRYQVYLPISSADQHFHFIANPPTTTTFTNKTEAEVMSLLETSGKNCAFWQKIYVPGGIRGIEQTDGTVTPTEESQAYFTNIPLIRNFAKVQVYSSVDTLHILQYALINVPSAGKVAPYDIKSLEFAKGYIYGENLSSLSFNNLYNNGNGYHPQPANIVLDTDASSITFQNSGFMYMYERPLPDGRNATCVLVEIQKNTANPKIGGWYKIEILNAGKYVPIYRDFLYKINVAALDGLGEATAQAALDGPAFGDISANMESASLTSISDGKSTLEVEFTDFVAHNGETSKVLHYWFTTTETGANPSVTVEIIDAGTGAVTAVSTPSGTPANGSVTLSLGNNNTMKKTVLRVSGKASESSRELYREIYVRVVGPTDMESATATNEGLTKGSKVYVNIVMPQDLGRSLFPMTIFIEADDNSLSAVTEDISVEKGVSKFNGKNTFYFVKTLSYSDYYDNGYQTIAPFEFEFNKTVSTAPNIKIWDNENFFNVKDVTWE